MDRVRLGTTFRAIRLELGLRQLDVALRASTSQQTVSRVERGKFGPISAEALEAVAEARHAALLAAALRARRREVRRWIAAPSGPLRGIWFLPNTHRVSAMGSRECTQRVSRRTKPCLLYTSPSPR